MDFREALEAFNDRLESIERQQRMLGQTVAGIEEMNRTHRQSHMDLVNDVDKYKAYVSTTFVKIDSWVNDKFKKMQETLDGSYANALHTLDEDCDDPRVDCYGSFFFPGTTDR